MAQLTLISAIDAPNAEWDRLTVIRPSHGTLSFGLSEFWRCRKLLYVFVWRDIKVRYKQTVLGAAWALLQPFLSMVVFTLVFGRLAKVPSAGIPYPVFVFCGLLPWQFFAHGLVRSGNSLVQERYLLTKVYVPRLIMPVSAVLSGLPDFAVAFVVLFGIMFHYGLTPTFTAMMILPLLMLCVATSLSVGLFLSALNVRYRDVGYTVPFFSQLWFFVTPIAYPASLVPERWRILYELNPMAGVVEGFRWAVIGNVGANWTVILASAASVSALLGLGLVYFQRMDRTFADLV
jgi:lipopolysaccharide transport system permease protein